MRLHLLSENQNSALVVVHPNWAIAFPIEARYNSREEADAATRKYFNDIIRLINQAIKRDMIVVVSWMNFYGGEGGGHINPNQSPTIQKLTADIDLDDYSTLYNALNKISAPNYQFYREVSPGEGISSSLLTSMASDSKIVVIGGYAEQCVADTVIEIKKILPRVRLLKKYLF